MAASFAVAARGLRSLAPLLGRAGAGQQAPRPRHAAGGWLASHGLCVAAAGWQWRALHVVAPRRTEAADDRLPSAWDGSGVRVTVPLPVQGQTVFALAAGHTVSDVLRSITSEDAEVVQARVLSADGATAFAGSTLVADVLRAGMDAAGAGTAFQLLVNGRAHTVALPTPAAAAPGAGAGGDASPAAPMGGVLGDAQALAALQALSEDRQARQALREEAARVTEELAPLEELRAKCQVLARDSAKRLAWVALTAMGLQFGFLARLTWWDFSWDIMEPVTYFITYGTQMAFCGYFVVTQREYDFETLHGRKELKAFYKYARREGLDVARYNQLVEERERIHDELRRL